VITEPGQDALRKIQTWAHANCVVCGTADGRGLRLVFRPSEDGSVQATFEREKTYEGYADILHGGVLSALLDRAITNCLFSHGHPGVTAELTVRFRHPVCTDTTATVRAWIERCARSLHVLKAELVQGAQFKATAHGKFMEKDRSATEGQDI
jgi:uncharacterized protein (TIGR00369 family)